MTHERYEQISKLFHAALEREPAAREVFLAEACCGDVAMHREVGLLIAAHEQAGSFIKQPPYDVATVWQVAPSSLPQISFAHYRLLSWLGKGGMGDVWLAEDTQLGRKIAIKLLPAEFTTDVVRVRRFAQEARAASALNHPNIVTIHEIGEVTTTAGRMHYLVTEYVVGETLRQRMADAPQRQMELVVTIDVVMQIAAALAAAHEAGIIHRDIKPENVMVRRDGIVKVLDFGLAKLTDPFSLQTEQSGGNISEAGVVLGTPRYMSPEQARGEKVDTRSDIFSLGVMLYEMIAGRGPFIGATMHETIAALLRDRPLPLIAPEAKAPAELERIVSKALQKERAERYQAARDLFADLEELRQIEIQTKLGEIGSVFRPATGSSVSQNIPTERLAKNLARKPFDLVEPALRAIAAWIRPNRQPVLTEKDLILLADFENKTGDAVFDGTLKQGLAIQLRQSPFLSLFSEERVRQTLQLMKRSSEERITTRIAREICLRHNLKALIAGSIAPLGSHYVITLEAIHGQTGEMLETEQVEANSKEQVLRALSQAAIQLRAKLGESLSSIQQFHIEFLEDTTTQELDAFQAYSLGFEQSVSGKFKDAIQLYRRAVELDPDFAYAWSMLSIHHSIIGLPALAAEFSQKAYALKDRVSKYEQLQITFRYHFNFTGDVNKALEAAILFKRMYPRTPTAPIDLLAAYDLIGRHDQAVAEGLEAVHRNPSFAPAYWYLGRSLLRVSSFAEAKKSFQQALERKFDLSNIHSALYQIACAEGDTAAMQQQLDWAKGKPEEYVTLGWSASAAAFAGQWRKAREMARSAIDVAAREGTKELAARYATEQALWGVVLENRRRTREDAAQGLSLERGRVSLPRAALALALCGESNQVDPLIDELKQRYPEDTVINCIWLPTIRAALLLNGSPQGGISGSEAEAIHLLQTTTSYEAAAEFWPQTLRGQAYLKLGRSVEAAMEFQKILDHQGQSPLSPLYPLAHLGLVHAATLSGDATKRQKAWEHFAAAWREADADLPALIEAKSEFDGR